MTTKKTKKATKKPKKPTSDGLPLLLFVDNRKVASETAHVERPICVRHGRDGEDEVMRGADIMLRDGTVIGHCRYHPDEPIAMPARDETERTRGVTVSLSFDAELVEIAPADLEPPE
jgi:hypothetical protein